MTARKCDKYYIFETFQFLMKAAQFHHDKHIKYNLASTWSLLVPNLDPIWHEIDPNEKISLTWLQVGAVEAPCLRKMGPYDGGSSYIFFPARY